MTKELTPEDDVAEPKAPASGLFRREALEAHAAGNRSPGSPLRISPRWVQWVYPLLVGVLVAAVLFTAFGSVGEYVDGKGIVLFQRDGGVLKPTLLAIFPGHLRPLLDSEMPIWLELDGFSASPVASTLAEVREGVVGPSDVRRLLGPALADSVALQGPLAIAWSPLPVQGFADGDRILPFHHGLQGNVDVRLGSKRILPTLLPALERFFSGDEQ